MRIHIIAASLTVSALAAAAIACGPLGQKADDHPTYYKDVAPILNARCTGCHVAGSIAPFTLDSYAQAFAQAGAIKASTASRIMPPWGPQNSGTCQTWKNDRYLTDRELKTIALWVDQGALPGSVVPTPTPVTAPVLAHVDATLDMGATYTPQGTTDIYRCFITDPGLTTDMYLTGYHVKPGARSIVHHIIAYAVDAQGASEAATKDAADAELGYTCFGTAGVSGETWTLGWAPGGDVTTYPAGTGIKLKAGQKIVVQIHYNLGAGSQDDRTQIDLQLEPQVDYPAYIAPIPDQNFSLPKGMPSITDSLDLPLASLNIPITVKLWALAPHMHLLGRAAHTSITHSDGSEECLLDQPHYDFRWQQLYQYETPVVIKPTDTLHMSCTWDTTNAVNDPTTWGENTTDEMCLQIAYLTIGG